MRSLFFFFIGFIMILFVVPAVQAGSLSFDQTTVTVAKGSTFSIAVVVDAGSDQITAVDAWITYDATLLEAKSASPGGYFATVTNNFSSGRVYLAGLVTDPGTYKTGRGNLALVTFSGLKDGVATLAFDCRTGVSNTSIMTKNDSNATNVIVCSSNGTSSVTIGAGGSTTPTAVPTVFITQGAVPTSLPQTGIADSIPQYVFFGAAFVLFGLILRILFV